MTRTSRATSSRAKEAMAKDGLGKRKEHGAIYILFRLVLEVFFVSNNFVRA